MQYDIELSGRIRCCECGTFADARLAVRYTELQLSAKDPSLVTRAFLPTGDPVLPDGWRAGKRGIVCPAHADPRPITPA